MWWFILCVNLTGPKDNQMAGKTLFLDMSVRFPEGINIWISELSKEVLPSPVWAGIIQRIEGQNRTKNLGEGHIFVLSSWAGMMIVSCPQTSELLVSVIQILGLMPSTPHILRSLVSHWIIPTGFPCSPACITTWVVS